MRQVNILTLILFSVLFVSSCKKYDEGPALSLRSRAARVDNTWKVEKYIFNGSDMTASLPADYTESYTKDGAYSYSFTLGGNVETGSGKWEFQNDDKEIKRSGVSGQSSETLVILKLKNNEFWYYVMDGIDKHEYHLVSK